MNHPTYPITRRLSYFLLVLLITLLALSLPLAPRAFAQDREGVQVGVLIGPSPDDKVEIEIDPSFAPAHSGITKVTRFTYDVTEKTRWIDWNGRETSVRPEHLTTLSGYGPMVWVKWRLGTGGSMEAVWVKVKQGRRDGQRRDARHD
jgi:hypothetical protein